MSDAARLDPAAMIAAFDAFLDAVGFELPLARVYFGVPADVPDTAA
jgi:hypothetical protein